MRPAYRLAGPRGRRYVFQPSRDGRVVKVRRVVMFEVVYERVLVKPKARELWRWLTKLGYRP